MRARPLIALALLAAGGAGCGETSEPPRRSDARVERVVDGDTLAVRRDGAMETVRLLGLDAPEASDTRYGRPDCGGAAAAAFLRDRLPRDADVRLVADGSQDARDRYGRLLRYVERDGEDVARAAIAAGWAEVYRSRRPFARQADYREAAIEARRAGRGVWAACGGDFHTSDGR